MSMTRWRRNLVGILADLAMSAIVHDILPILEPDA